MDPIWLLLIVPAALALGAVAGLAWLAHEFLKGWW